MTGGQVAFNVAVVVLLSVLAALGGIEYFRRFRLARPAVGAFNGGDIAVMMGFVVVLPFAYLALPSWALPATLGLVFFGGLAVGYEPVVRRVWLRRGLILGLLAADAVAAIGVSAGWLAPAWYWLPNSVLILLIVVSAANLSAQGGLHLRHAAAFALALAVYDAFFATVVPLTQQLADAIAGYAFAPSAGMSIGGYTSWIGMGDLLVYALYATIAYKAYGRTGAGVALGLIVVFGALVPALTPAVVQAVTGSPPALIPAQIFFGPAGFLGYLALRRTGPERKMIDILAVAPA